MSELAHDRSLGGRTVGRTSVRQGWLKPALQGLWPAPGATPAVPERPPQTPGLLTLAREDMACVFDRDPAARSRREVLLTYPGLHAMFMHRLAHRLWQGGWRFAARWLGWLARFMTNVDIHPGATIGRRFFIDHGAGVVIGETAEIGDDCTLYHGVTLGGTTWNQGKRHPTLGSGVVVGAGAKILGAIRIGDGARVGANSVVIREVPAGRTAIGIPARLVGESGARVGAGATAATVINPAINLDHHLIPDPVGKAIQCLLDRIDTLEVQVRTLRGEPAPIEVAGCSACAAGELCCEEHGRG